MCDPEDDHPADRVIHCWSGPRCVSTSLMYSFAQRSDTQVLDEPLYAHYLHSNPTIHRPYRDLVLSTQDSNGNSVVDTKLTPSTQTQNKAEKRSIVYSKHMAKHRAGITNPKLITAAEHFLLVRSPEAVISSFSQVLQPTLQETCYTALLELYSEIRSVKGKAPPVILSEDVVADPAGTLRALCSELGVDFDPAMLSWPAGPKPDIDGVWAPWWYARSHTSTGFMRGSTDSTSESKGYGNGDTIDIHPSLRPLLEECRVIYEFLRRKAVRPATSLSLPPPLGIPRFSTHAVLLHDHDHERNKDIMVGMRDSLTGQFNLVWRPEAKVSVMESGYFLGDGVWEGMRVHKGSIVFAQDHFDRLYQGAKAIDMDIGMSKQQLESLVYQTLQANGMAGPQASGIHIRLMVTRGARNMFYQNPNCVVGQSTIVIFPEWKRADPEVKKRGIRLSTVPIRRGPPDVQDPALNSHSKLNCITACIAANKAGADEALMLDTRGYVATCNSTNFFVVMNNNEVWTAKEGPLMPGITRSKVIDLCRNRLGLTVHERDFTLTHVYSATEAFVTGTFAGQIPVLEVDGRCISKERGPITTKIQQCYDEIINM